jgi:hypothetical protein
MSKTGGLALVLAILLSSGLATGGEVILKSRRFVPARGLSQTLCTPPRTAHGRMHVLIQLEDIPTTEWQAALVPQGVRLLSYIPDRAWLASIPADGATQISKLAGVRAICEILPQDKLAPSIRQTGINACSTTAAGQARLTATLFEDVSPATGAATIERLGGTVLARDPEGHSLECCLPVAALYALAACDGIKWIDQPHASMDLNDGVRTAINAGAVQIAPYDLSGSGIVIGQWESKHPDGSHVDLIGRVVNVGDEWPIGDHATQVAGTMIGDGALLTDRRYRGVAPAASLVSFHTWENVAELRQQYRQAIDVYGIDIANNSWGKVEWHVYKDYAAAMDGIVRGSLGKRLPMVWAVGNEGGWGTILCTAVAKNIVTVGATNSDDNSLWTWSNKGPTADGRLKPEIVSPGCEVRGSGGIWSTLPGNRYGGACGTSLAAPSVAGTIALILEDWRAIHGGDPLPSTIKGLLIHTATDLGPTGPDYAYGYGLVNAKKAIDLVRIDTIDDIITEDSIFVQGERDTYVLELGPGETELRITLVWDDYPADPLAAHALVNDLDLVVIGPGGKRYYPWTLDPYLPQAPAVRTQADHTNNVEQVYIENPPKGTWLITVWGTTVPYHNQAYSLLTSRGGLASELPATILLSIFGHLGGVVAEFDDAGNLILQGQLTTETEGTPPADAFVIRALDQTILGYIDPAGNMSLKGRLTELSACAPVPGGFFLQDGLGLTVASIDRAGNLCLMGRLYENP